MTEEEIISDYPDLTHEDILASLSYAADRERSRLRQAHGDFAQRHDSYVGTLPGGTGAARNGRE